MHRAIQDTESLKEFGRLIKKYSAAPIKDESAWDTLATIIYTGGTRRQQGRHALP